MTKFKVGDKIIIYGCPVLNNDGDMRITESSIGIVMKELEDGCWPITVELEEEKVGSIIRKTYIQAHPKQCEKYKEKLND